MQTLTVGQLRQLIADLPDSAEVWDQPREGDVRCWPVAAWVDDGSLIVRSLPIAMAGPA